MPSLLRPPDLPGPGQVPRPPAAFEDLNLFQLLQDLYGADELGVAPLWYQPATEREIHYRQAVVRDLQSPPVRETADRFVRGMRGVWSLLATARRRHHPVQQQLRLVSAILELTQVVEDLARGLDDGAPTSEGFAGVAAAVRAYLVSPGYLRMRDEARTVRAQLARVRFRVEIHGPAVGVGDPQDEPDYAAEVRRTFERFAAVDARVVIERPEARADWDRVEASVVERVATLHPDPFAALDTFTARHDPPVDPLLSNLERELSFYLPVLDLFERLAEHGLTGTLPVVSPDPTLSLPALFDVVLAAKQARDGVPTVTNDFSLDGQERIAVVTGPNQGGKTTLARAVGHALVMACLGLPVAAGTTAVVPLIESVRTHFPQAEVPQDESGGLRDEMRRARAMLDGANARTALIVNEIFSDISLPDAIELSGRLLRSVSDARALCVWVTFLDEIVALQPVVSYVAQVDPHDPAIRTFRVRRQPPDGRAHAMALARKHALTSEAITARIRS